MTDKPPKHILVKFEEALKKYFGTDYTILEITRWNRDLDRDCYEVNFIDKNLGLMSVEFEISAQEIVNYKGEYMDLIIDHFVNALKLLKGE